MSIEFKKITEPLIDWIATCDFLDSDGITASRITRFANIALDSLGTTILDTKVLIRNQLEITRQLNLQLIFQLVSNEDDDRINNIDLLYNLERWITENRSTAPKLSNTGSREVWTADNGMYLETDDENEQATYQIQLHCVYEELYN